MWFCRSYRIYASSERSHKPAHAHTLARAFTVQKQARIQKVLSARVQRKSDNVFVVVYLMSGVPLKSGHHRPASETPFKWRFTGGPTMALH